MSVPGSAAVQNSSKETHVRGKGINLLSGYKPAIEVPPLSDQAERDLKAAAEEADKAPATSFHKRIYEGEVMGPSPVMEEPKRLQAEIGEIIARKNITKGVQLDRYSDRFPNYDVGGEQEMCQVKVLRLKGGSKTSTEYQDAFQELVNPNSRLNGMAAERLLKIKKQQPEKWEKLSPHLPSNVREANSKKAMRAALADRATMRVPEDQVEAVRADLREHMTSEPEKYGFDPNSNPQDRAAQIEQMVQTKVLSIDERFATIHYTEEAKKLWSSRELDAEKLERRNAQQGVSEGTTGRETPAPEKSSERTPASENKEQDYSRGYGY